MISKTSLVALHDIALEDTRYSLSARAIPSDPFEANLKSSMAALGLQTAVLLHETGAGRLCVVDGFRRLGAAAALGWQTIPARVLSPEISGVELFALVAEARRERLAASLVKRLRFLHLAHTMKIEQSALIARFMPLLGMESHEHVLRRCLIAAQLPEDVLDFCETKNFSLKQCLHLTRHPREQLEWIFAWRERLSLTASMMEEVLNHLKDYLNGSETSLEELKARPDLNAILYAEASAQERTRQLRDWIRSLRFPLLTRTNRELEQTRDEMHLPAHIRVSWDPTLEHQRLDIAISITSREAWRGAQEMLGKASFEQGLADLLEGL